MKTDLNPSINKVKIYSIITIFLIIVSSGVSYWTAKRIEYYTSALMHTQEVLQRTDELYASILERETNIRGYLITQNKDFITYYNQSIIDAHELLNQLQQLTVHDAEQQNNIAELRNLVESRVRSFDASIEYIDENGTLDGFLTPSRVNNALNSYRMVKDIIMRINSVENKLFLQRNEGLINNINALPFIIGLISLFSITIGLMTFFSIYQYNKSQQKANKRISAYQERLGDQIQLLDDSNKELEQFAYVASHDLQEPLRKITAFSDLLNEQYGKQLEGEGELYLNRITAAAVRMRMLITDLLEYSRAGKVSLNPTVQADLTKVIQGVIEDMEIAIKDRNAEIILEELPVVLGAETEYRQVFQNLVSNALKFSDKTKTPKITVSCEPANPDQLEKYIGIDPSLKYHHIRVADNGIGFGNEHADKIFSIFQRLHGKNEFEGTGIGLSITRKIIEKNEGIIYAESTLGEGAVFHIILPSL